MDELTGTEFTLSGARALAPSVRFGNSGLLGDFGIQS